MSKFIDLESDVVISGPLIAFGDNRPLITPAPFADAIEHFRFGGSAASRTGLINGRALRRGVAQTSVVGGASYTSAPAVALAGAGAAGLTATGFITNGGAFASAVISGQPLDDGSAVTATLSGGSGGAGAAVTLSRGVEPTYTAASLILTPGRANGLISDIDDALLYTEAYLMKRPAAGAGTWIGGSAVYPGWTASNTVGGDGFFWTTGNQIQWQSANTTVLLTPPASWAPGTYGVLIVAYYAGQGVAYAFGPDGTVTSATIAAAKILASPQRKRAIGGVNWDFGTDYRALELSSFAYWASALTAGQMASRAYDMLDYARDVALI